MASARTGRPVRAAAVALVVAMTLAVLAPGPAGARQDERAVNRLVVTQFSTVIGLAAGPDGGAVDDLVVRAVLTGDGGADLADVDLVVETFGRLTSRGLLHRALDADAVQTPRVIARAALTSGDPPQDGDVPGAEVRIQRGRLATGSGVYPVQISAVQGTTIVDQVVTAVVVLDEAPVNPLRTTAVWPLWAPTSIAVDGRADDELLGAIAPGGRLDVLVDAVEATSGAGIVLAPAPHLLAALLATATSADATGGQDTDQGAGGPPADQSDPGTDPDDAARRAAQAASQAKAGDPVALAATMQERLRALLATAQHPPVAGAWADADLATLVAEPDLARLAGQLALAGREELEARTGRLADATTFLATTPLTPEAVDLLPGEHVLLPWDAVEGPDLSVEPTLPPATRSLQGASGRVVKATVADPHVARALTAPDRSHGSILAVQRVMVETAMVYFETPGIADRPLLLQVPQDWEPGGSVARRLAARLPASPWLDLVAPSALAGLPAEEEAVLALPSGLLRPDVVTHLRDATAALATAQATLVDPTTIDGYSSSLLQDAITRTTSSTWSSRPDLTSAALEEITGGIARAYGSIEIPSTSGITMTAEEVPIPITIRRTGGDPINVEVEVLSSGQLQFPSGATQTRTLPSDTVQTLSFDARARSRGTLPVRVIVRTADGATVLAEARLSVRSTTLSGPALAAVGMVVLILLVLGRRRRRGPLRVVEPETDPPSTSGGASGRGRRSRQRTGRQ